MRIQWNSGAVEEALARLRSAQDGLEACKSRAQRIRRQFADANPDGENRALRAAENRFAQCWTQMQRLAERVDGFESALRRADANFMRAEAEAGRYAQAVDAENILVRLRAEPPSGFYWQPAAVVYMPEARSSASPLPDWLEGLLY